MKQMTRRVYLFLFLLVPFSNLSLVAQNLTGIWRGYFVTENYDNYKFEIQIKQTGSSIAGVSYSYLTTVFYGKASLTGSYTKTGQTALIREIRTTELRMSGGSSACIMKCVFEYSKSGREEFLEGTYTSKHEKDSYGAAKGDDCGSGKVYLRKVTESDFYVEPFLRKSVTPRPPVVLRKDSVVRKTNPPVVKKTPPVKTTTPPPVVKKPPVTKPPVVKKTTPPVTPPVTIDRPKTDSVQKAPPVVKQTIAAIPTPNVLKTRTNELVKTLVVNEQDVTVKIYDNGEIDDDTISVYMDKKLVLSNKRLTTAPLVVKLKLDQDNPNHELVMVAENLGRIPPNTSLMIVESGEQRFEVRITSTEQKNAMVRFRYEKP
jgi:hypothetical protein